MNGRRRFSSASSYLGLEAPLPSGLSSARGVGRQQVQESGEVAGEGRGSGRREEREEVPR